MQPKRPPSSYPKEVHKAIIETLLIRGNVYSYTGLVLSIKEIATNNLLRVGNNKAKEFLTFYLKDEQYISKKDKGVYLIKPL